jgi:trimeric autotransporter adhesin
VVVDAEVEGKLVTLTVERDDTTTATAEHASQQQSADLTIDNVETTEGKVVAETTKSVKFMDTAAPEVTGIKVAGPKKVTVQFSEPLSAVPTFKFDGGTNTVVTNDFAVGAKEVTITLGSQPSVGAHKVEVSGGSDYANFSVDKVEKEFDFANDTAAPAFTVKSATNKRVVLVADEAFANATNNNVEFYHTGSSSYKAAVAVSGKEITLTFSTPLPEGQNKLFLSYASETGTKIEDAWGNKVAAQEFTLDAQVDRTAPMISGDIETVNASTLRVTFSETVANATTKSNYELKVLLVTLYLSQACQLYLENLILMISTFLLN